MAKVDRLLLVVRRLLAAALMLLTKARHNFLFLLLPHDGECLVNLGAIQRLIQLLKIRSAFGT